MESIFKLGILLSVIDRVTGPSNKIGLSMTGLRGKVLSLGPAFDKFKTYGLLLTTVAAGVLHMMAGTVMATTASQKALGELASVGITNLAALEQAGTEFSGQWSGTTKAQFISAAYDIKSGISSLTDEGVAEFAKLAALTGKATKSTTAEMTSLFATGYGIYKDQFGKLSDMQFGEVFSAGIAASVKNFKTTGSGMAQAISQLGATATSANIPLSEQLSILGMLQATMTGSEAGTKYKALMQAAAGAGEKLNLQFLDANRQLLSLPEILMALKGKYGATLDAMEKMEIQKAFGTQEAVAVIDLLYGKVGVLQSNIISLNKSMDEGTTFTEAMAAAMNMDIGTGIDLLAQRWHNIVEVVGKQLIPILIPLFSWIGEALNGLTAFAQAHESLTQGVVVTVGAVASLVFVLGFLAAALGALGLLAPNVMAGFSTIKTAALAMKSGLLSAVASTKTWILWQRQAFLTTLYVEGGLLAYAKTLATAPFRALKQLAVATWGHITALYAQFTAAVVSAGGIKALVVSMGARLVSSVVAATRAAWGFTTALLANPITWVVIAIAVLVAGLIVLEKEFGFLSQAFDGFMYGLGYITGLAVKTGKMLLDAFLAPFRFLGDLITRAGGVGNALKALSKIVLSIAFPPLAIGFYWDGIKENVPKMMSWIRGVVPKIAGIGRDLWGSLTQGAETILSGGMEKIRAGVGSMLDRINSIGAMPNPFTAIGSGVDWVVNKFQSLSPAIQSVVKTVLSITFPPLAIVFNWDSLKAGVGNMLAWIRGMVPDFVASGKALWGAFTDGIRSMAAAPIETVKAGLTKLRNLLPFSDAKEGPLSTLTLSGTRLMETIGTGISAAGPGLVKTMSGVMAGLMAVMTPGTLPQGPALPATEPAAITRLQPVSQPLAGVQQPPAVPAAMAPAPSVATVKNQVIQSPGKQDLAAARNITKNVSVTNTRASHTREVRKTENHFHINGLTLSGVSDADGFVKKLLDIAEGFDA